MKKILILDDKEAIAKILSMYIGKENEIVWFDNPQKGIVWLDQGNIPDLIITDLNMPIMSGEEFLKYIKQNQMYREIKVIILSSNDSTTEKIRLLEMGAIDYIVKPFNPVELNLRVKKLL
ncbi:Phosphate regulon transcriptional regulatory protein PhoB [bioreactor metagenome]|uniref:Phosphate regulon transcriptional regulatory protein PhoB n=1 Tax=bioreactor metagenome TaxID=1076179 RepID=A0A644TIN4_9ZZZZ|nr:response regulator [Bacteroidales bacterium]MEA4967885.1 response regulator [Bacteroidaceae bacterium]MEA5099648.1 response regulator [Bacteroidales bacterium]